MTQSVKILLGTRTISLKQLAALKHGSVIALEQGDDENVHLLVAGTTVGKGRLITAGDNLAVTISNLECERTVADEK